MRPKKRGETWVYPHLADVLHAARLKTVAEYIAKRRQTVHRTIVDRPILEECRGAERLCGSPVRLKWWEQDVGEEVSLRGVEEEEDLGWLSD